MPSYRLFVASTRTGQIVADVPFVGTPRWEYRLNSPGSLTATIPLGAVDMGEFDEWAYSWRWSWGLAWGSHILQCGPVITDRYQDVEGPATADIAVAGIWQLLTAKRVLVNPTWTKGENVADAAYDTNFANLTLRTIAKRIVENDLARAGHTLPIVLPTEDGASTHERSYPGYDLAMVGERLYQLTQVIDGPEIEFRPEFTDSTQRAIRWRMRTGGPRLGQLGAPHAWDYGKALTSVDYDRDGSSMTFGHWERGNGMERSLLSAYQDSTALMNISSYPFPALETVGTSSTSVTEQDTLQSKADGYVATYGRPTVTWSATVRMDGQDGQGRVTRSPSIDVVSAGDTAWFQMVNHRRIKDGSYVHRILGVTSGPNMHTASLILQPTI